MPIVRMPDGVKVRFPDTMSREEIKGMILKKFPNMENNQNVKNPPKQIERQRGIADNVSEFVVTNPVSRAVVIGLQGIANSSLNPFGYIARSTGMDTAPLQAQNGFERVIEQGAGYGFDAAALAATGGQAKNIGLLGKGVKIPSKIAQSILAPSVGASTTAALGSGAFTGYVDPKTTVGQIATDIIGGTLGGGVHNLFRPIQSVSVKSGLKNALYDNKAMQVLRRGNKESEDVAQAIADRSSGILADLNDEAVNTLQNASGHNLNIKQSVQNQKKRMVDFIANNKDRELINFGPTRQQIEAYPAQSKFNLPKNQQSDEYAQQLLKDRAEKSGIDIGGSISYYTKNADRKKYVRTLSNTLENPDIKYSKNGRDYLAKKYDGISNKGKKTFFDFIVKENGGLYNKFNTDGSYVVNKLKEPVQNVSLSGQVFGSNGGPIRGPVPPNTYNNSISYNNVVVNPDLPNMKNITEGLTEFQKEALEKAIAQGKSMSNEKLGSLGATHRAQQVLNDMIEASMDKSVIGGAPRATTETSQLMGVKERLNSVLDTGGIKPFDKSYSKAKTLEHFYETGYKSKPSEVKFALSQPKTLRDRQAFLQGLNDNVIDNIVNTKSVSKGILDNTNTYKKLLPENKYNNLMNYANKNKKAFERMTDIANAAEKKIINPLPKDRPLSEKLETVSSFIGSQVDKGKNALYRQKYIDDANAIINGTGEMVTVNKHPLLIGKGANFGTGTLSGLGNTLRLLTGRKTINSVLDLFDHEPKRKQNENPRIQYYIDALQAK